MCYYRYVYYGTCSHAEFYRSSYCDKACERQQTDDLYWCSPGTDNTPASKPGPDPALGSPSRHQQQPLSARTASKPSSATSHRQNSHSMSTATPSEVGTAFRWAEIALEPDTDALRQADLIPRSVQPDRDVANSYQEGSGGEHHQHRASQSSPTLDTVGYDKLNINIPFSPYASGSLSMRFTHEHDDGNSRNRASSSSTFRQSDINIVTDTETVRTLPTTDNSFKQQSSGALSHSNSLFPSAAGPTPKNSPRATIKDNTRDGPTIEGKKTYETTTADLEYHGFDQRSPRKSIPPQWMAKTKGPLLATAQRAKEREARKQKSHGESPNELCMKTVRGARSSIDLGKLHSIEQATFLTKSAAVAVENDITTQPFIHTPKTLRHTPSKSALKTPTGSPVRESPGRHSATKITVASSTMALAAPRSSLDSIPQCIASTSDTSLHLPAVVSSAGSTPFVSAKQSPVSSGSVQSFGTAKVSHDYQILDPDLTDASGDEQMTKSEHGAKSLQFVHSRGKSEPNARLAFAGGKTTSSKPWVPKLSLRIPYSSSSSTDRRSPIILGSASSSGSGTPASPSQSSRIPRIFVPTKNEHERSSTSIAPQSGATLRRSMSAKTLVLEKATKPPHATAKSSRATLRAAIANNGGNEDILSAAFVASHDVPLPETTVVPSSPHVRTVDSLVATPILSRGSAAPIHEALSLVSPCASTIDEDITITNTIPTDDPLAQDNEDKHHLVKSYLEHTEQMEKPSMAPLSEKTLSTWNELKCIAVPMTSPMAEITDKLVEWRIATRECTEGKPKKYTSRSASVATVNDVTIERDPAIIFHRKKMDPSDSTISGPVPNNYASSTTSTCTGMSRSSENRFDPFPIRAGRQEHSEPSQEPNFTSNLRATAPVFRPQQHSKPLAEFESSLLVDGAQQQQPIMLFDPFALDMNGIPWYHYMYPVPTTPYRKKSKYRKYVGPKPRGYTNGSSPTKAVRSNDTQAETRLSETTDQAKENSVSELKDIPPGKAKQITVSSPIPFLSSRLSPTEPRSEGLPMNIKRSSQETSPFETQMNSVIRQDPARNDGGLGRATKPIDWSSIHNVPSRFQSHPSHFRTPQYHRVAVPLDPQANVHAGFGRNTQPPYSQQYPGRQHYHHRPGGNGLYDNFSPAYQGRNPHAAAGVPLHATAPFPNPLPPPGPRICVEGSARKGHVGYKASGKKDPCSEMIIESAVEWGGGPTCNNCAESNGER